MFHTFKYCIWPPHNLVNTSYKISPWQKKNNRISPGGNQKKVLRIMYDPTINSGGFIIKSEDGSATPLSETFVLSGVCIISLTTWILLVFPYNIYYWDFCFSRVRYWQCSRSCSSTNKFCFKNYHHNFSIQLVFWLDNSNFSLFRCQWSKSSRLWCPTSQNCIHCSLRRHKYDLQQYSSTSCRL